MNDVVHATCDDVLALVHQFLDRELGANEEALVREHLAGCEACADEADCWQVVRTVVRRSCVTVTAPEGLVSRIQVVVQQTVERLT